MERSPGQRPYSRLRERGFSFIELLVVMGAMAVLMALAVGYIGAMGKTSEIAQAKGLIEESVYRCINASVGTQRAFLIIREDDDPEQGGALLLETGLAGTVLTHQFETLDYASDARVAALSGHVELKKNGGHTGSGGLFRAGGLVFPAESRFAMTEGLEFEAWIQPESGPQSMTLIRGQAPTEEVTFEIALARAGNAAAYDVRVALLLREPALRGAGAGAPLLKTVETQGAPIPADGRTWIHVAVVFDGRDVRVLVGGVEVPLRGDARTSRTGAEEALTRTQIHVPPEGVVKLSIGGGSYRGLMDSVVLRGVFRSRENSHRLPDRLQLISPALPVRIEYANGRLSGSSGSQIELWFRDLAFPSDLPLRFVLGRAGTVSAKWTKDPPPTSAGPKDKP